MVIRKCELVSFLLQIKKKNLFKEWSFHVTSTQQVQLTSNPSELNTIGKGHRHIKMFPEMRTYIQTGPNMAAYCNLFVVC
jgi:hypothetical protein